MIEQQTMTGRTKRSIYNVTVTLLTNLIIMGTAFAVQRTLVLTKGSDYNGINGLFTNIISMMSLADLGIGTAIIYHLYRPAAENDYLVIRALLEFYKKSYFFISMIVLFIGLILFPLLPGLVGTVYIEDSLYLIFGLFLFDSICSYFLSYKKSLLYAYQMNYVVDGMHFIFYMVQNALQICILLYYQNFIAFLIVKSVSKCIENVGISFYIHMKFPFMRGKGRFKLTGSIKCDIIKKVKALLYHRLGKLCVQGSDSLVITGILGITQMSLYTNYQIIIGGITALLYKIFETLTSSVGNFLIASDYEKSRLLYRKIDFINYMVFGSASIGLFTVMNPMVRIWVGAEFLFLKPVLFVFIVNFYLEGMRASVYTFKDAAGIYYVDRYVPIVEAVVNVVASVFLAYEVGMAGVFWGTIISKGIVFLYSYPKYVCGPLFRMTFLEYWKNGILHLGVVVFFMILSEGIFEILVVYVYGDWAQLWLAVIVGLMCTVVGFIPLHWNCKEMKYCIDLIWRMVKKDGRS